MDRPFDLGWAEALPACEVDDGFVVLRRVVTLPFLEEELREPYPDDPNDRCEEVRERPYPLREEPNRDPEPNPPNER